MSNSLWPHELHSPWNSPGQDTGVGSLSLLWGIFPTQGSDPGLPHCRRILYQLSHKGSPRILEWIVFPFSSGSSWPRNPTRVSCIAGGLFTKRAIRKGKFYSLPFSSNCPVWPLSSHSHGPRSPSSTVHLLSLPSLSCLNLQSWIQASSCPLCAESCLTLCNPMDYSPLGSFVHRILQERILVWDVMPSSSESSWPRDQTHVSCVSCFGRWIHYHWVTWAGLCLLAHSLLEPANPKIDSWEWKYLFNIYISENSLTMASTLIDIWSFGFYLFYFFKFYFIFKFYIIVLVLPNIKMNPPQVYMACTTVSRISGLLLNSLMIFFVVLYMTGLFLSLRIFFCVSTFWIIGWLPLGRSFFQLWCRAIIVIFWYGIKFSLIPLSTKYLIISSHFLLVQFSIFVSSLLDILYNILFLSFLFYLCNFYSFLKDL